MNGRRGDLARPVARISPTIAVARVICILGIVYVHAWTGLNIDQLRAQGDSWHSVLYWALIELLGRSSVPLLSIISGWLVASSVAKRSYGGFVAGKVKVLLLPMLLWNVIAVVIVGGLARWAGWLAPDPAVGMALLNEIVHLTAPGEINVQNAFLRDVFVCMLVAPLLVRAPASVLLAAFAATLAWSIEGWQLYILLRPQILLFFLLGMIAYRLRFDESVARIPMIPVALVFLVLGAGKAWLSIWGQHHQLTHAELVAAFDNLVRVVAAVFFWKLAGMLAAGNASFAIRRIEPYAFLLFCCHVLLIWIFAPMIGPWFGRFGEPGYPVFLLLQPALAMLGAVIIGCGVKAVSPALAGILSGGRLK